MGFCAGWQGIGGQRVASHDASMREAALYNPERTFRSSALIPLRVALLSVLAGVLSACASTQASPHTHTHTPLAALQLERTL
ncbi:MAG: hypothetical protein M0008_06625 [Actinomycetota bacterium]|nr:hypothetical protein [Actinomycetota bacterium]